MYLHTFSAMAFLCAGFTSASFIFSCVQRSFRSHFFILLCAASSDILYMDATTVSPLVTAPYGESFSFLLSNPGKIIIVSSLTPVDFR